MKLQELAETCANIDYGNRELDARIWCAIERHRFVRWVGWDERVAWGEINGRREDESRCSPGMVFEDKSAKLNARYQQYTSSPSYTLDLNVARKLIPPFMRVTLHEDNDGFWHCRLTNRNDGSKISVRGYTAELAICAAALYAQSLREHYKEEE